MQIHQISRRQAVLYSTLFCVGAAGMMPTRDSNIDASKVIELPETIGDFRFESEHELTSESLNILNAEHAQQSVYRFNASERRVVATLIAGSGGAIASHHVDVCYSNRMFQSETSGRRWIVPETQHEFQLRTLRPRQFDDPALTVAYAWKSDQHWVAPNYPRFALANRPWLQRLQVSIQHPLGRTEQAEKIVQRFVAEFAKQSTRSLSEKGSDPLEASRFIYEDDRLAGEGQTPFPDRL